MEFERPVRRAHETIEVIQRILTGSEPVEYDGELITVDGVPPVNRNVPIYHAALGPANRRVVGRLCNGWMPHNIPFPNSTTRSRPSNGRRVKPIVTRATSRSRPTFRQRSATIPKKPTMPFVGTLHITPAAATAIGTRSERDSPNARTGSPTHGETVTVEQLRSS